MDAPNKDNFQMDQNVDSDENELQLVMSGKNTMTCAYLAEMLKSKFDGIEVEMISCEEFEQKFSYRAPFGEYRENAPKLRMADSEDKTETLSDDSSSDFFVCQICGEQVDSTGNLEWHVKAKHSISHLKEDTKFKCFRCGFLCSLVAPMYKHVSMAHNNGTTTDIYPVFEEQGDIEIFNKKVLECFPSTQCQSTLVSNTDVLKGKSSNMMYYGLKLSSERREQAGATRFVMPSLPLQTPQSANAPPAEKDDSPYLRMTCNLCDFTTKSAQFMENHMAIAHAPKKPSTCGKCGYVASSRQIMVDHLKLCRYQHNDIVIL